MKVNAAFSGLKFTAVMLPAVLVLSSCARKMPFVVSPVVPSATGQVVIRKDENKNSLFEVRVRDLAPPARLTPPKTAYVVWVETKDNSAVNLGQLVARRRESRLDAVSAFKPVRVFVTAEDSPTTSVPSDVVVLETKKK